MLPAPCFCLRMVETGRRRDWREEESVSDAVRRLIGVMDERKVRGAAVRTETCTARFADPVRSPLDERPEASSIRVENMLRASGLTVADLDSGGMEYGGRAARLGSEPISFEDNGCARPTPDEAIDDRSRRNRRSGGL